MIKVSPSLGLLTHSSEYSVAYEATGGSTAWPQAMAPPECLVSTQARTIRMSYIKLTLFSRGVNKSSARNLPDDISM